MPQATSIGEFYDIFAVGPAAQLVVPAAQLGLAASVPASGSIQSDVIPGDGFKVIAVGVTSAEAGAVDVQRYLDLAGTIPQGAALTGTLVAGTGVVVNATDGLPFGSFRITVTNTTETAAALTGVIVLLQAA